MAAKLTTEKLTGNPGILIDWASEHDEVVGLMTTLAHLKATEKDERANLEKLQQEHADTDRAQEILQLIAQAVQQQAHERISEVVTSCLRAVFPDDPYEFRIRFERKRGKTEAVLVFVRGDVAVDPITASGGGVVDVAAFALRVACLVLHRPRLSRLLVLDEPFKFVSQDYLPNVRKALEELSKEMNIQIIMISHIGELDAGKIINL
jgi:ABC-type dipeptide/oligopeptide/nickel transport system ATPase subunit